SAGRALASSDWRRLEQSLRDSLRAAGPESPFDLTRLSWAGAPDHYFAVQRAAPGEHATRLEEAGKRGEMGLPGGGVLPRTGPGRSQQGDWSKAGLRREHDRAVRDRDPAAGGCRQPGGVDREVLEQVVIADEANGEANMRVSA